MIRLGRRKRTRSKLSDNRRYEIAAAVALALIIVVTYWAFAKQLPFQSHYEIRGVFAGIGQLRQGSEVRISGVTIGTVKGIGPGPGHTSTVTMQIDDRKVPIRQDATLAIAPRLALEGNDYVNVSPGTPGAGLLQSGGTIPVARTSEEVQLNQVLDVLNLPTRQALTSTISSLAQGLGGGTTVQARPGAESGSQGLSDAARELAAALGSVTTVVNAAQGTHPGDLGRAIGSTGDMTSQLASNPAALANIVTNFNRVTGALADENQALAASIRDFDQLTQTAPGKLVSIDRALPPLTSFANDLRPALGVAPPDLGDFYQALVQLRGVAQPGELPRLLTELRPVTANLPPLERQLKQLFGLITPVTTCVSRNVVPTLDQTLADGPNSTGRPVWQDMLHLAANLAGAASDFDGNGTTIRLGVTSGEQALSGLIPGIGNVVGIGPQIEGIRPVWLGYGKNPPYRPDQPCDTQPLPNLSADSGPAPSDIHYSPIPALSSADRRLAAGLFGTAQDRQALLKRLLAKRRVGPHGSRSGR